MAATLRPLGALALTLALVSGAAPPRTVVPFDFGWRHTLLPAGAGGHGPGAHPAEAAPAYNDSAWARVRLPHDGLIALGASNTSCPTGCSGKSFIPRREMWYRKSFVLPAAWSPPLPEHPGGVGVGGSGSSVWVEFDGVFHACVVYLNGVVVAKNAA